MCNPSESSKVIMSGPPKLVRQLSRSSSKLGSAVLQRGSSVGRSITRSLSSKSLSGRSLTRSLSNCSLTKRLSSRSINSQSNIESEQKPYLLEELGGFAALSAIMQEFGRRLTKDPMLQPFFQEVNPQVLTAHQERFFAMAFTEVNVLQASLVIRKAHKHLFEMGLCEDHFDVFTQHFEETLMDRGFADSIVDQAMDALQPLREIIQDAAEDFQEEQQHLQQETRASCSRACAA